MSPEEKGVYHLSVFEGLILSSNYSQVLNYRMINRRAAASIISGMGHAVSTQSDATLETAEVRRLNRANRKAARKESNELEAAAVARVTSLRQRRNLDLGSTSTRYAEEEEEF